MNILEGNLILTTHICVEDLIHKRYIRLTGIVPRCVVIEGRSHGLCSAPRKLEMVLAFLRQCVTIITSVLGEIEKPKDRRAVRVGHG
jgi:hypothetical protein